MPVHPGPRLQKVTLNLYWADMRLLETKAEWSVWVRNVVHEALGREQAIARVQRLASLGDHYE